MIGESSARIEATTISCVYGAALLVVSATQGEISFESVRLCITAVSTILTALSTIFEVTTESLAKWAVSMVSSSSIWYIFELEKAEDNYDYEKAAVLKHGTIPKLQEELATLKFNNTNTLLTNLVDEEGVANIISKWTNIPVTKLIGSEKDKLLNL